MKIAVVLCFAMVMICASGGKKIGMSFHLVVHGPGFICNRITFDAVKPFVYTAPIETGTKTGSF